MTGHRVEVLPEGSIPALKSRIADVLNLIEDAGAELFYMESACFAGDPQKLRFVSPVADGADQIAAEVALERGWELQAVLPFQRGEYRETLANAAAKERFDHLIERATCVLELPGDLDNVVDAYVMTGRATVSHCDILIAVWDGLPPRGRGGTAEVVQLALTRGTAVIHIPPEPDARTRVLWAAFDPTVLTVMDEPTVERPLDGDDVDAMLRGLLMPPPDQQEQHFLDRFFKERLSRVRARIEYPLLLMRGGVRRFKRAISTMPCRRAEPRRVAALSRRMRGRAQYRRADRLAGGSLLLGRPARDPFRPDLPQRPHLHFRDGRRCGVHGPERVHGAASEAGMGRGRDVHHHRDHPQRL